MGLRHVDAPRRPTVSLRPLPTVRTLKLSERGPPPRRLPPRDTHVAAQESNGPRRWAKGTGGGAQGGGAARGSAGGRDRDFSPISLSLEVLRQTPGGLRHSADAAPRPAGPVY
eukprot:365190-Chlamydomonas_euryale.AAC.12